MLTFILACTAAPPQEISASPPVPPAQPDVVLVVVDTLRADHLSLYGYNRPTSPFLDKLAGEGLWFRRAYAQAGWTLPSFSSILTGLLPHEHGVGRDPVDPRRFGSLPAEVETVAERFQKAGYATAAVVNNTFLAPAFGLNQGFETYDWVGADTSDARGAPETIQHGLAWLDQQKKPTFLLLHFMEPHLSYDPGPYAGTFVPAENPPVSVPFNVTPEQFSSWQNGTAAPSKEIQAYIQGLYDEEILRVDHGISDLVEGLRSRGRWSHTILAVTADHGEEFWDHGGFEHGHSLHGELTHIPLVLAGDIPVHGVVDTVVQHVDLARALVDAAGGADHAGMTGTDLFAIAGAGDQVPDRTALSENCLYGYACLSAVNKRNRVLVDQIARTSTLWSVDDKGGDGPRIEDGGAEERVMLSLVGRIRGNLDPAQIQVGPAILSSEQFEQLKALGYVKDDGSAP